MTITTYGVNVPAGLFLPGMIIGCSIGNIYAIVLWNSGMIHKSEYEDLRKNLIVIGVAATLAGYTRMTYSLAVIVLETSQVMNLFVPIVFTILISNQVGYVYTRSLYERAIRDKQMPILVDDVPEPCKYIIAEDFMEKKVISVHSVEKVKNIVKALKSGHHAFPVLNKSGNAAGIIPRNFLITILRKQAFYNIELAPN